jgi:diguanylate cyclase (GGDEF)-like protein/PAS domain S-box-containing protein
LRDDKGLCVMQTFPAPVKSIGAHPARIAWRNRSTRDAAIIFGIALVAYLGAEYLALFDGVGGLRRAYGNWRIEHVALGSIMLSSALAMFALLRLQDVNREVKARLAAEAEVRIQMQRLHEERRFLQTVLDNVPATISVKELPEFKYVLINREGEKYFGIPREQILGKAAVEIYPKATADVIAANDKAIEQSDGPLLFGEHEVVTPGKARRIVSVSGIHIDGEDGKPRYIVSVIEDVTERKQAEARAEHLARHDPLTDLANRMAFNEYLDDTIAAAAVNGKSFAVLCIDLDRFKEVNDIFGHIVGDGLLCAVAKRLQAVCTGAFLARLGGDEFTIICTDEPQPSSSEALAERLLQAAVGDVEIAGNLIHVGMSVGVAVYPTDGTETAILLANSDAALYRAKAEARGSIRFFAPDMDKRLREKRALQHDLRSAIARGEIAVYYQPQATIGGEVVGFEALARWKHPVRGMVSPAEFIPLAEESGLIIPIGEWILREACREAASWPRPLRIAVNLSPVQFRHGDLPSLVFSVLLETGLAPDRLEVEITEGVLIDDFARAVAILRQLKTLGVRIAMDDFGTGYSSLSYLQSFPFDKIKIDQAFIANLERSPQSAAIIRAVIGLGGGLELPIVAEGVENNAQLAFLTREACNEVQGYLIGRPEPIETYSGLVGRAAPSPGSLALAS